MTKGIFSGILDLVFPPSIHCIACGNLININAKNYLCDECDMELSLITGRSCQKCGKQLSHENQGEICFDCASSRHLFRKGYACVNFSGLAKNIVRDMKYRGCAHNTDAISGIMADRFASLADEQTGELPQYDFMIFAPMHISKKDKRGYDQAELIAQKLSPIIGVPLANGTLERTRETSVMSSLGAEQRKLNLESAFSVTGRGREMIRGKALLLVDDVFTTGSTADACTEALLQAGATSVDILTFAAGADYDRAAG